MKPKCFQTAQKRHHGVGEEQRQVAVAVLRHILLQHQQVQVKPWISKAA